MLDFGLIHRTTRQQWDLFRKAHPKTADSLGIRFKVLPPSMLSCSTLIDLHEGHVRRLDQRVASITLRLKAPYRSATPPHACGQGPNVIGQGSGRGLPCYYFPTLAIDG